MNKFQYPAFRCKLLAFVSLVLFSMGADAQSLLWKIDAGTLKSPSYIYGTIHIKDKRVFQIDKKVFEALEGCSIVATEVELNSANLAGFAQRLMLPEGKTLKNIFKPDEYNLIKNAIEKETGLDMTQLDRMKPFALLSIAMNSQLNNEMEVTIDEMFYNEARKEGKKIVGLETLEEQLEILEKIPNAYVIDYFENMSKVKEDIEEIITDYCRADLNHLLYLMQKDKAMATMEKQLITIRNKRMTGRIIPLVTGQPTFIAVGAGHLPGKKGILSLLEKKGYMLSPVNLKSFDGI